VLELPFEIRLAAVKQEADAGYGKRVQVAIGKGRISVGDPAAGDAAPSFLGEGGTGTATRVGLANVGGKGAAVASDIGDALELGAQLLDVSVEFRATLVSKQNHGMEVALIVRLPLWSACRCFNWSELASGSMARTKVRPWSR
jgi:hypothetical protein